MSKAKIEQIIVETLRELQGGSGDTESVIDPVVVPLSQLGFFDSLLAIETTLVLEQRLGFSCGADNVFSDNETAEPLAISDIATRLMLKVAA